jgi:arsenate reductase-like glutaredoxin family protein
MADSNQGFPEDVNTVPAEDGTTWVEIASSGTDDEARLLKGFLEAEGITAQVENLKFEQAPINFGTLGEIRVYVASEDEARAQELLRQRNREYERLDDDDETLVTDEGPAVIDENAPVEGDGNSGV